MLVALAAHSALAFSSNPERAAPPGCIPSAGPCNRWASHLPVGPANEVHLAVNPLDSRHILAVAKDYSLGDNQDCRPGGAFHVGSASYVTFDGGETWATNRVPAPYPNGGAQPSPLRYMCGSDPVAMFGPDGTAYYLVLNFQYTGGRQAAIAVARSLDGGRSWPAGEIRILHTSGGDDKEWGAVDNDGRVHVVWADLNQGRVLYSRSNPATWTFEAPRVLFTIGGGNPAVTVAGGLDDDVYVVWRDSSAIKFMKSTNAGATWSAARVAFTAQPYQASGAPRLPWMPQIAVDANPASPYAGRVYVTWPDARLGDSSVWMSSSGDGGATWTAAVRVDDNVAGGMRQVMPTVSVAPNGRVDIAWLDERDGPNTGSFKGWTTYTSSSTNGGASWGANVRTSTVPLNQYWSRHQDGSVFIGDYMGIASTNANAIPIFPGNGFDRLGELTFQQFQRADAYIAMVQAPSLSADAAAPAPLGLVPSLEVGDVPFGANDPFDPPYTD